MTGTILDKILEAKRVELARHKRETPLAELESRVREAPFPLNLSGALWGDRVRLIAEVKKASPSKGLLAADYDPGGAGLNVRSERRRGDIRADRDGSLPGEPGASCGGEGSRRAGRGSRAA